MGKIGGEGGEERDSGVWVDEMLSGLRGDVNGELDEAVGAVLLE